MNALNWRDFFAIAVAVVFGPPLTIVMWGAALLLLAELKDGYRE